MECRRAKFADNVGGAVGVVGDLNCIEDESVVDAFVGALEDWNRYFLVHYNVIEVVAELDGCNTFLLNMFLCFDAAALG